MTRIGCTAKNRESMRVLLFGSGGYYEKVYYRLLADRIVADAGGAGAGGGGDGL